MDKIQEYKKAFEDNLVRKTHYEEHHRDIMFAPEFQGLLWAIDNGYLNVVKYIIDKGIDVGARTNTALYWACIHKQFEIFKYLVEKGADINIRIHDNFITASGNGSLDIVKYFVENGANIDEKTKKKALWHCCRNHHTEVKEYLKTL